MSETGYGVALDIRPLVCLATDDATQDTLIEKLNLIVSRAIIDLALKKYVGVPLANPPVAVVEIANLLTAGLHLTKNAPEEKEHPYTVQGKDMLEKYVATLQGNNMSGRRG